MVRLCESANRTSWKLHKEFIDEGYNGKNPNRMAFKKMMDLNRQQKFEILLT